MEPEIIAVNGNGHHIANGIGPTVELVPSNGHVPANGNINGHHDDDGHEPQQMVFSWAEFMAEEPVKLKRRNGKPQPASMSMFEWAAEIEQARKNETDGAGR